MKDSLYLYSDAELNNFVYKNLQELDIKIIKLEDLKNNKFENDNILLIIKENLKIDLKSDFFLNNSVVLFFLKKNDHNNKAYFQAKTLFGKKNIEVFLDVVNASFISKPIAFNNIKIFGEEIINIQTNQKTFLTSTEKNILTMLFKEKKIDKNHLLENVLNIKKDTETKTIESHLTRIRKKLLNLSTKIEIYSKQNIIYLKG